MTVELLWMLSALITAGLFAGFVAGLFGIGGGTVIVPALVFVFSTLGYGGERVLHVAVGTSLAVIAVTSARSVKAHRKHGAVDEKVLKGWRPWIVLGAVLGAGLAMVMDKTAMGWIYGALSLLVAAYMGLWPEGKHLAEQPPKGAVRGLLASSIGTASALMGVGGGAFGSASLSITGMPIHTAIATASGFGVYIAVPAALGYTLHLTPAERPPLSVGDVNLIALGVLALFTSMTAQLGAKVAHRLSRIALRRLFAVYMLLTAGYVIWRASLAG